MLRFLFPPSVDFMSDLERSAAKVLEGAQAFHRMVSDATNASKVAQKTASIKEIEHQADRITHDTIDRLNKTFITPIDREDIHALASRLDDVMDSIDRSASRLEIYGLVPTDDIVKLAEHLVRPIDQLRRVFPMLEDMKNASSILKVCVEVNRLENEADRVHREALRKLFATEEDPIRIIQIKEILEALEDAYDRCEDVANIVESVVIKNS
jgi:uncharacterized protein